MQPEPNSLFAANGQVLLHRARRGSAWTRALLSSGDAGARVADAFLRGREDLPERRLEAIDRAPVPVVIGSDPVRLQGQLRRYLAVLSEIDGQKRPGLRRAGLLGLILDYDPDVRREFRDWAVEQTGELASDLDAVGDVTVATMEPAGRPARSAGDVAHGL